MSKSIRPRGTDGARVIQVIETRALRGRRETLDDVCREVVQYWDFNGKLLAEFDSQPTTNNEDKQ